MIVNHEVRYGDFLQDGAIGDDFAVPFDPNLKDIGDPWENDGIANAKIDGLGVFKRKPLEVNAIDKVLLNELPHSRTGIDYHYRWLIEEGRIEIHPCNKDRRVRYACPSERLITPVRVMMESLEGCERSSTAYDMRGVWRYFAYYYPGR